MKKTILTGLRVNSELTLGNYLGALLPMVRLANKYSKDYTVNIFVPDLHSIISDIDGNLKENTVRSIKYYLAAGLKLNDNVHIYRQSRVPAHADLAWVLNCVATMGEMSRMIQYKEKSEGKDSTNVGIFDYPVLMAADILLYDASFVPVGEDQFQHIELTRNLAQRFNHRFGDTFVVPEDTKKQIEFMGAENGIRIRDLVNPEKKMSKSTAGDNCKIMLSDAPERPPKKSCPPPPTPSKTSTSTWKPSPASPTFSKSRPSPPTARSAALSANGKANLAMATSKNKSPAPSKLY